MKYTASKEMGVSGFTTEAPVFLLSYLIAAICIKGNRHCRVFNCLSASAINKGILINHQ